MQPHDTPERLNLLTRRDFALLAGICLAVAFLLYSKTFGHGWTYDDFPVIVNNPDILSFSNFLQDTYPGRPLRELTYLLDVKLFGLNPGLFQIQNIFWHGLNGLLLGALLLRCGVARLPALGGALLFLCHPLTVEVVANASHRKDSLALAFSLLSLLCYLHACTATRRWQFWLALAGVGYLLACQAKQIAIGLPLAWTAFEFALPRAHRRLLARRPWLWLAAGLAGAAGLVVWLLARGGPEGFARGAALLFRKFNALTEPTLAEFYAMALKALAFATGKLLWPLDLAPEYTFSFPQSWADPWVLAGAGLLLLALAGLALLWRRQPLAWAALVWTGLFWAPVANLWPLSYLVADRYLYAPLAGLVLLAVLLTRDLRRPAAAAVVLLLLAGLCAGLTWRQQDIWASELTLWSHVAQVSPLAASAQINLGVHAMNVTRDYHKARDHAQQAVQLNPLHPIAHKNLGLAQEALGQREAAIASLRTAYRLLDNPDHPQSRDIKRIMFLRYRLSP